MVVTPLHPKTRDQLQILFQNLDNACAPKPNMAKPGEPPTEFSVEAGYTWEVFRERVERVAADYLNLDGDVICFAEIDREFFEALSALPPFSKMQAEPIDLGSPRSMAVFSKLLIDSIAPHRVETERDLEIGKRRRPLIEIRLGLPQAKHRGNPPARRQLALVLQHLTARGKEGGDTAILAEQSRFQAARRLRALLDRAEGQPEVEGVLSIGDNNAEPNSEEIAGQEGLHATLDRRESRETGRPYVTLGDIDRSFGKHALWGTRFRDGRHSRPDQTVTTASMLHTDGRGGSMWVVPNSTLVIGMGSVPEEYLEHYDPVTGQHYLNRNPDARSNHLILTVRLAGVRPRASRSPDEVIRWSGGPPS